MGLKTHPKIGIEIEFAMDIEILKAKLDANNIEYMFVENPRLITNEVITTKGVPSTENLSRHTFLARSHSKKSSTSVLVVKPDKSVGLLDGWELNFPPTYSWEDIKKILDLTKSCNPTFPTNAALHVHVDTYLLSQYNIDQIHSYYYNNQEAILNEAKAANLYLDLNAPVPKVLNRGMPRKINLNIKHAMRRHKTIEHRIYKSTINIDEIKWCVNQTLNIINNALTTESI